MTRAEALKKLSAGEDPAMFFNHDNYHVRYRAYRLAGQPVPAEELSRVLPNHYKQAEAEFRPILGNLSELFGWTKEDKK